MDNKVIIYLIAIVVCIALMIYGIMSNKAIEWLKYAVTIAEKELGSGTGQLKLRQVYDMFIDKYPGFSVVVPFKLFSYWVDTALKWLEKQLDNNMNVKRYISGE